MDIPAREVIGSNAGPPLTMSDVAKIDPKFLVPGTVFTTLTINKNFRTAAHFDAGDGSSTFTDSSLNNTTITSNNSAVQSSTQKKFGSSAFRSTSAVSVARLGAQEMPQTLLLPPAVFPDPT